MEGALLVVSHDRYFIQNLADKIIEIEGGKVTEFKGTYDEFTDRKRADDARRAQILQAEQPEKNAQSSYRSKADRAQEAKRKQRVRELEEPISVCEAEIDSINAEIAKPEIASDYKLLGEKCARLAALHREADALYAEYEKLI